MANIERLTILRDYLRNNADDKHFNMESFFSGHSIRPTAGQIVEPEIDCGTVACMAGFACTIPEFRAFGLRAFNTSVRLVPFYRDQMGFYALTEFFALSPTQASYLFDNMGGSCVVEKDRSEWTLEDAVRHLSDFIERKNEGDEHHGG